ncbi:ABC transporter substrate-binding protein [Tengunoibacter tsumagoiensis]|uniref:ABC transporter substrate-binding protein n=1 Tax=Tengunoibacter tsumagoiensis TaxID=2014871 RepID=A0A401ZU03_9CHLR|nr:ABC transporter substrate-binding protein [Tengunoibacter tsumagoiensis]GCE10292.1 ABC transporter substrate-binding protein [Tengunoibacter tsumagoiensis]
MVPEQREALDESITWMRAGRMSRRRFLERMATLGLTSTAAVSLLEACGGSANSPTGNGAATNLVWQSEQDSTPTYRQLVQTFNETIGHQKGIHVTWNQGPSNTNDLLSKYTNMLRAKDASIDILSIDIVYPAQFAASQWIRPISDSQWPVSEREKYLAGPLKGCTYKGQIWAAPFRTDVGLIYYRTDLVSTPPATWDQLTSTAQQQQSHAKYGYVWQGAQYEGLVCNFVEVLYGYGGRVLDPNDPTQVRVNSPEGRQALERMVSWVGTISPEAVTTYMEDPARLVWQNGDAVFMRNWPYAYLLSNDPNQSQIKGKFAITGMPHGGSNSTGHSSLGGWNLSINAFSPHAEPAWEFIKYLLQPPAQKKAMIEASQTTTLKSLYDDHDVLNRAPLFGQLKPILETAEPRPVSPRYTDVSDAIQRQVYQALRREKSPDEALRDLEEALKKFSNSYPA